MRFAPLLAPPCSELAFPALSEVGASQPGCGSNSGREEPPSRLVISHLCWEEGAVFTGQICLELPVELIAYLVMTDPLRGSELEPLPS